MGFHMIKLFPLLALFAVITSCVQKPEATEDHGPVVPVTEIQNALIEAWGNADPLSIKVGDFVYLEKDQSIEDMPARVVGQEGLTVADRTSTAQEVTYKLIRQINEITNGQSKLSTREEEIVIPNVTLQSELSAKAIGVQTLYSLLQACIPDEDWNVSCHNLKVKTETGAPPSLVKQQANCGGIPNCEMTYKRVSFDLVLKSQTPSGLKEDKVNYSVVVSPEAPYLAKLMSFCYRGVITVSPSNAQYLVQLCDRVLNFQSGPVTP